MDRTERFYRIDALLQANRAVSLERMLRNSTASEPFHDEGLVYA